MIARHYLLMQKLQRVAFRQLATQVPELAMASVAAIDTRESLLNTFQKYGLTRGGLRY